MKSLSQLKKSLQESPEKLDEIALKTATSVYKKRIERGEYTKAVKTGDQIERKIKRELKESSAWSLPIVLVLHRKTIRNFSDGTKVALYYNDRLDKYFTIPIRDEVPLVAQHDPIQVSEDVTIIDHLAVIKETDEQGSIKLKNGESVNVIPEDAEALLNLYDVLFEENKGSFIDHLSESTDKFTKLLEWSLEENNKL